MSIAINYLKGDATKPIKKPAMIIHICNDKIKWGAGFVLALSKQWKGPEVEYKKWGHEGWPTFGLGCVQYVSVEQDVIVANMIGQRGIHKDRKTGQIPLRYDALKECLEKIYKKAEHDGYTVHMPRIGCGLAGGEWDKVEKIIEETITVETYVYDIDDSFIKYNDADNDADNKDADVSDDSEIAEI